MCLHWRHGLCFFLSLVSHSCWHEILFFRSRRCQNLHKTAFLQILHERQSGRHKEKEKDKMNNSLRAASYLVSLHLLCFSPLQWLTQDFKHETFRDQWIPLITQYLKFCITFRKCTLFVCFSTRKKDGLYPRFASYCEYHISSLHIIFEVERGRHEAHVYLPLLHGNIQDNKHMIDWTLMPCLHETRLREVNVTHNRKRNAVQ